MALKYWHHAEFVSRKRPSCCDAMKQPSSGLCGKSFDNSLGAQNKKSGTINHVRQRNENKKNVWGGPQI